MAVRFRNEHTSWAVSSPITWKIEIFDADHVGGVTDFEVESGVGLTYRATGDDINEPILASSARFSMVVQNSTHEQLITDLAGAKEGRFTVVLYKDDVFHWAGVINSPEISIEDADYPFSFEITAVDGLALLKNYEYKQNITSATKWTEVYEGQNNLVEIAARCLKKLPHVVTHFTGSSKFLVTAVNWYNDAFPDPVTATSDPFNLTYLDNRGFAQGQGTGAAKFNSCFEVLSYICGLFNARISLVDGYFLIEQIEHRAATIGAPANYSRYYDYALTAPTANTLDGAQAVGNTENVKKLRGGTYSFAPALRAVKVKQSLNGLQNLIQGFQVSSSLPSVGYTVGTVFADGLNTYVRLTGSVECKLDNIGMIAGTPQLALFKIRIELGGTQVAKRDGTISGDAWSYDPLSWDVTLTNRISFFVKINAPDAGESTTVQSDINLLFPIPFGFTQGDLTFDFDFENLYFTGVAVDGADYDIEWTLKNHYLDIISALTTPAKSVIYEVAGDEDNTEVFEYETIIGDKDSDIINQWRGLLYFDSPDYFYTELLWGNRNGTRDRPIIQLLAQRLLAAQYFPRKILRGTAVGSAFVIQDPIEERSETYILKGGTYNTARDEMEGEWVKLEYSSETITYLDAVYDTGEYEATTPAGGAGGGGVPIDNGDGATVLLPSVVQGDILYGSADNLLSTLAKNTSATRYLSNTGSSNNPAWAQVDLSNGVIGSLPFANIGTIATQKLLGRYSSGTGVIEQITISTGLALDGSGNLTASGSGGTVTSVDVSGGTTGMTFSGGAITTSGTITMSGTLDADNGGTGQSTVAQGDLLYGSAVNTWSKLAKNTSSTRYLSNTGTSNNPAWAQIDLTNGVTGALPAANGGTGQSTYTVGDILYASAATTLTKLNSGTAGTFLRSAGAASPVAWSSTIWPNSATTGDILYASAANTYSNLAGVATGNALISGGVSTAPSWGKIGLTTHVSGTLDETNGGTGQSTVAQGDLLYGSAVNTWSKLAKNTSSTRYLSNTGTSNNPAWAQIDLTNGVTGTLPVGSGGTGQTTFTANRILYGNGTSAISSSANLTFDGTTLNLTGKQVIATTGSYSSSQDFLLVSGTITSTANSLSHNGVNFSLTYANDGTTTGQSYSGLRFTQTTSTPTAATTSYNVVTQNTNTSANVSQLYGIFCRVDENTTTGDLSTRIGGRFDLYKNVAATDIHTATGIQVAIAENSADGRWKQASGNVITITNAKTIYGAVVTLTNNRGTANTQYGLQIVQNASGTGTVDNAIGLDLYHVESGSGSFANYYAIRSTSTPSATATYGLYFNTSGWRNYINGSLSLGVDTTSQRLTVRGSGATSATVTALFENSAGTDILYIRDDGNVAIGNSSPQQTLHVTGTMRLTGSDGTATALMGRDADGDISAMSISSDLAITSGTLGLVASTIITPPQISSTQNNYNPTGLSTAGIMLISADNGFRQITGITAPSTAKNLTVVNIGSYSILFPRESTSSSAANRIRMNRDFVLLPGKTMILFYDTAATKWRILSIGDTYSDTAHLYFDNIISSPTQTGAWSGHWQYASDGSDWITAPTGGIWSGHELDTGATSTGVGYIGMYNTLFQSSTTAGEATWAYFRTHITTPSSLSSGGETYIIRAGFMTANGAGTMDGIYFRYSSASSANWRCITRSSATETDTNTTVAVAASTTYLIEIVFRPDGTTEFWLDGVSRATNSTNVPLTDLTPNLVIEKTAGSNSQRMSFYTLQATVARVD